MFCQDKMLEIFQAGRGRGRGRGEQHRHARGTNAIRSGREAAGNKSSCCITSTKMSCISVSASVFIFVVCIAKITQWENGRKRGRKQWEKGKQCSQTTSTNVAQAVRHRLKRDTSRVESSRGSSIINSSLSCTYAACFYSNCQLADKLFDSSTLPSPFSPAPFPLCISSLLHNATNCKVQRCVCVMFANDNLR